MVGLDTCRNSALDRLEAIVECDAESEEEDVLSFETGKYDTSPKAAMVEIEIEDTPMKPRVRSLSPLSNPAEEFPED